MGKSELADGAGIDRRTLTMYLSGERVPSNEQIDRFAAILQYPSAFFVGDDLDTTDANAVSFRSLARMGATARDKALAQTDLAAIFNGWIEQRFELPAHDLPELRSQGSPETAAIQVRRHWGLGESPVGNIVRLFEAHGIRVFSLVVEGAEVDAISTWRKETPFVFLNTQKSAERSRFDAAHELGHLVLHRHARSTSKDQEKEAHQFASAFLMPSAAITASVPAFPSLNTLIACKKRWRVSVASLAYRLRQVGHITEWNYRTLAAEIAEKRYNIAEPEPTTFDHSSIFPEIFTQMREEGVTRQSIASDLAMYPMDVDRLVTGLTVTQVVSNLDPLVSQRGLTVSPQLKLLEGGQRDSR